MAKPEHVEVVLQGVMAIARWREANPGVRLDLSGADFTGADLSDVNLTRANHPGHPYQGRSLWSHPHRGHSLRGSPHRCQAHYRYPQTGQPLPG